MIAVEVCVSDNKITLGGFRINLRGSSLTVSIGGEIVPGLEWHDGYLFGTLEQAITHCLLHQTPDDATHYKKTMKNNYRYYKKDSNSNWLQYVDKRYPLGWQPIGKFDDLNEIKPLT